MKDLFVIALFLLGSSAQGSQFIAGVSPEEAYHIVGCVARAYPDRGPLKMGERVNGYSVVSLLPSKFGFIGQKDRTLLVAIRGSDTRGDYVRDLQYEKTVYNFNGIAGTGHCGFLKRYGVIAFALEPLLEALTQKRADRLILAGHSLGGAMASIAYANLCSKAVADHIGVSIDALAVGTPGVFDEQFVNNFQRAVGTSFGKLVTFNHTDDKIGNAGYENLHVLKNWYTYECRDSSDLAEELAHCSKQTWYATPLGEFHASQVSGTTGLITRHAIATYHDSFAMFI